MAISLLDKTERFDLEKIAKFYSIPMRELPTPTDADVQAVVEERLTALLEARLRERDKLQAERSRRFAALARSLAENEEESPVLTMLLDDYYQQLLHAPAPQPTGERNPEDAPSRPRRPSGGRRGDRRRKR
jgi:ATP-dependent RNA helicase DeaD